MNRLWGIVVLAALGAAFFVGRTTAQGPMKLTAQDYIDIRQLMDAYPRILDNCCPPRRRAYRR